MLCNYGCGQEAKHQFQNGKWCCGNNVKQCPAIINKTKKKIECKKCGKLFDRQGMYKHFKACSRDKIFCLNCNKEISFGRKFCNLSCSASYNMKKRYKNKQQYFCKNCGKPIKSKQYCNNTCRATYIRNIKIEKWLNGELEGCSQGGHVGYIKHYLLEKYNHKCPKCGWGETNPHTKTIPLEVEHINGNPFDNDPKNVTLLCPNCHSLTSTFRGANRGNGRRTYLKKYYMRNDKGKIM